MIFVNRHHNVGLYLYKIEKRYLADDNAQYEQCDLKWVDAICIWYYSNEVKMDIWFLSRDNYQLN